MLGPISNPRPLTSPRGYTPYMRTLLTAFCIFVAVLTPSCSSPKPLDDPAMAATDRDQSAKRRVRAVEQLAADLQNPQLAAQHTEIREQLKTVAWGRRNPSKVRVAAIDALAAHDESDTRRMVSLMLPTETSPDTLRAMCDRAAGRGWTELTPALVRSWSRDLPTIAKGERPEPAAVAALHPETPIEDVVFNVFAGESNEGSFVDKQRRAAWEVLGTLDPSGASAARRVADLPPSDDPLISAVRHSAEDLGAVPVTQEQLEWLTLMRAREQRGFYRAASRLVAGLSEAQRDGLALRHSAALVASEARAPERLEATRAELLSELSARLSERTTTTRSAEGGVGAGGEELLSTASASLSYADLLHVLMIDDALRTPEVVAVLFAQADRDHADTSTEYGGVLRPVDGRPALGYEPVLYPPRPAQRRNDKTFIAAPEMFSQHPEALAHFHFHVQDHRNSSYAGPGPGDRAYADRFGRANVVLTFVSKDQLAADYYHPGGLTLDLGRLRRPAGE